MNSIHARNGLNIKVNINCANNVNQTIIFLFLWRNIILKLKDSFVLEVHLILYFFN